MYNGKKIKWVYFAFALLLLSLFFVVLFGFFVSPNAEYHSSRKLTDYSQCIGRSYPLNCRLFPEQGLLSEDNCEFYDVYWYDGSNTPEFLTYAKCSFSKAEFENEIRRISELANEYSDTCFEKPAYILYYNRNAYREYALVDEGNYCIHFICCSAGRFLDRLPNEDRIKLENEDFHVPYNSEQEKAFIQENGA